MFRFLASKCIRDWDRTDRPEVRAAYGRLAGILAIVCNGLLFLFKLLTGLAAGSVAIVADAVNNISDAASNVISLLGFRLAARPADEEHPYGHGRYEYLAGLTVSVLVLLAGLELLKSGVGRILHPETPAFSWPMALVLAGSIVVKLWMMAFNADAGKRISSSTLAATAMDSRNDAIATSVVLFGMGVSAITGFDLDGYLGVGVALFILWSGCGIVRDTLDPLLGRRPEPEVIESIRERILACPGVLGTHDLLLHDYGPGRRYASAHVEFPAEDDIMTLHRALAALAAEFLEKDGLHILFQLDPISRDDSPENRLQTYLIGRMASLDTRLTVHDLEISQEQGRTLVRFDCFAPPEVPIPEGALRRRLAAIVREQYPEAEVELNIDHNYMSPKN